MVTQALFQVFIPEIPFITTLQDIFCNNLYFCRGGSKVKYLAQGHIACKAEPQTQEKKGNLDSLRTYRRAGKMPNVS